MRINGKREWLKTMLAATLILLVAACGSASPGDGGATAGEFAKNADGYADITVEQLASLLKENQEVTLVNVHIPYEGEIAGTDLFIPFDQIGDYLGELPDKSAPIVLYCRSGSMSTSAARELVAEGYTNVLEVDGGFNAWKSAGYELVNKSP